MALNQGEVNFVIRVISVFDINTQNEAINVSTYLHPFEVGYLLKNRGIEIENMSDAYKYKNFIFEYITENINLKNNDKECEFISANLPPKDEFELAGGGLEVEYTMQCEENLKVLCLKNTLFADDFELQTNKNIFYQDGSYKNIVYEKILTSKITKLSFDYLDPKKNLDLSQDTDNDGLTDHDENLYLTNLNLSDTDFDEYSDKEEIENGWDPRSAVASIGQLQIVDAEEADKKRLKALAKEAEEIFKRENTVVEPQPKKVEAFVSDQDIQKSEKINTSDFLQQEEVESKKKKIIVTTISIPENKREKTGSDFFGTSYLTDFLRQIQSMLESESFFQKIIVLFLAFILGILHSLEPGHGKGILISYLIDQKKDSKDAFRFVSFMTLTHLIDVVLLGVVFKVFSMNTNTLGIISAIQRWGVYLLLLVSIFLFLRSIFDFKIPSCFQNGKILGVASGLAPCTIGWALMIAMLSIGQINWLFPVILFFGLGIFSALMLMSFILLKTKKKIIKDNNKIMKISSIISATLLFIFALMLL